MKQTIKATSPLQILSAVFKLDVYLMLFHVFLPLPPCCVSQRTAQERVCVHWKALSLNNYKLTPAHLPSSHSIPPSSACHNTPMNCLCSLPLILMPGSSILNLLCQVCPLSNTGHSPFPSSRMQSWYQRTSRSHFSSIFLFGRAETAWDSLTYS